MNNSEEYSSILLDSGLGWIDNENLESRYMAFKSPEIALSAIGHEVTVKSKSKIEKVTSDPLLMLDSYLKQGYIAVGYIGYEYSQFTVEGFSVSKDKEGDRLPDISLMFYNTEDIVKGDLSDLLTLRQITDIKEKNITLADPGVPHHFCPNMSKFKYIDMIQAGKNYISQGDIYQANLSQKMTAEFKIDPLKYFLAFHRAQPVPYGSYLDFGEFKLLSGSMELFLQKRGTKLTTKPIKGTIKRGGSPEKDTILKAKLISSEKERAENLMIVDLMRNDLGRVCSPGSVKVNKLFEVETYNTLHQMVSEVEGEVNQNIDISQIVKSVFPPGSVTGAPKKRTLEIIDELEPHLRGPYCGAIGIFYPDGDFTLSVAIRVMTIKNNKANFWVGGGIVWDSDPEKEYEETILKSRAFTKALSLV